MKSQSNRKKKRIKLLVFLIIVAELLILSSGRRGFFQQIKIRQRKNRLSQTIQANRQNKEKMEEEKGKLSEPDYDPAYIEKLARELYGMAKEIEVVYQVIEKE